MRVFIGIVIFLIVFGLFIGSLRTSFGPSERIDADALKEILAAEPLTEEEQARYDEEVARFEAEMEQMDFEENM